LGGGEGWAMERDVQKALLHFLAAKCREKLMLSNRLTNNLTNFTVLA